jgi:nicotinamide-nucleotide amidase
MPIKKRLEILSLGSEFLLGLRDNAQLSYIGRELSRKGLSIARDQEIRDNEEEIRAHFLETWNRADIVMTVGGLGPTADDMTREVVCAALGVKLVEDRALAENIVRRIAGIGLAASPGHKRQAMVPEGAEILPNKNGTAPGIWLEKDGKILIMLPGPGHEMRPIFMEEVLPRLEARDIALINDAFLQLRVCGIVESEVDALLSPLVAPYGARVSVGVSCTSTGLVDIRIGAADESVTWKDLEKIGDACRNLLGDNFVGYGDVRMAEVVAVLLRERSKTISVAESCTGGLLSSAFAEIPGVSKVFRGGVVCYNNDIKEEMLDVPEEILQQHGAVSAETAVALALGAQERLDSDYALSVTGFAGPEGGSAGSSPVGTIFIGFASPEGAWSRKLFIMDSRQNVRERAVMSALDWMRRRLIEEGREAAKATEQQAQANNV